MDKKIPGEAYSDFIRARFWLTDGVNSYVGIGRVELLEKVHELGSINKAAQSMSMSYKKAWKIIEEMNSMFDEPLLVKVTGGKSGGGSVLTEQGLKVVKNYRAIERELKDFLVGKSEQLFLE
ncbi:winged helix-turn-helix domain-containing protein [Thiomicrorhabdus sediminis]|nr:LysR family transcriptional regulator [Thiomicrorhabdus sediminis]